MKQLAYMSVLTASGLFTTSVFAQTGPTYLSAPAPGPDRALTVESSGAISIGAQSAGDFKLRVDGSSLLSGLLTIGRTGGSYDEIGYNVSYGTEKDSYHYLETDFAASVRLGKDGGIEFRNAPKGSGREPLNLQTRMVLTRAGNVAIGGEDTSVRLDVIGSPILNGDGRHLLYLRDTTPFGIGVGADISFLGKYDASGADAIFAGVKGIKENAIAGDTSGALVFLTAPASTSPKERMRIDSQGHVGIGTSNTREESLTVLGGIDSEGPTVGSSRVALRSTAAGGQQYEWYNDYAGPGSGILALYNRTQGKSAAAFTAQGRMGIGTHEPNATLDVNGQINCTVLELTSDRNQKHGFQAVDAKEVLEKISNLPIQTWQYTNAPAVTHIGPTAQDFKKAFNLGSDEKHIATVDADGVLFACVQALQKELQETKVLLVAKANRIAVLEQRLTLMDTLAVRLGALEMLMAEVSSKSAGIARTQTVIPQPSNPSEQIRKGSPFASLVSE